MKPRSAESFIRSISRRGTYNTITFSNTESVPTVLLEDNVCKPIQSKVRNLVEVNVCVVVQFSYHFPFFILLHLLP